MLVLAPSQKEYARQGPTISFIDQAPAHPPQPFRPHDTPFHPSPSHHRNPASSLLHGSRRKSQRLALSVPCWVPILTKFRMPLFSTPSAKRIPLETCQVCGSTWFREVCLRPYVTDPARSGLWPDRVIPMPAWVLVCLCGALLEPNVGGVRGGRTPNLASCRFRESFAASTKCLRKSQDAEWLRSWCQTKLVSQDELAAARKRFQEWERFVGRRLARENRNRRCPRGRLWQAPERQASDHGADRIVLDLQKQGFTFREARKLVRVVFAIMKKALRRGESVETPLGVFEVVASPPPQTRIRFRRIQTIFCKRKRIRFRPNPSLAAELPISTEGSGGPRMNTASTVSKGGICPRCGSNYFQEVEYRQYRKQMYSSAPGGNLSPVSELSFRALVCLCGHVIANHHSQWGARLPEGAAFYDSVTKAAACREARDPEKLQQALVSTYASRTDLENLLQRLGDIERHIRNSEAPKGGDGQGNK